MKRTRMNGFGAFIHRSKFGSGSYPTRDYYIANKEGWYKILREEICWQAKKWQNSVCNTSSINREKWQAKGYILILLRRNNCATKTL